MLLVFLRGSIDLGMDHRKAPKKTMRYPTILRDYMFVYTNNDCVEIVGYAYSDFRGSLGDTKSTSSYVFKKASQFHGKC